MKLVQFILIILILSSLSAEVTNNSIIQDVHNFEGKRLSLIKEEISSSTDKMHEFGAKEAVEEIKENILLIRKTHQKVQDAESIDEVIEDVAKVLNEIANSYTRISENKTEIFKAYNYELKDLLNQKELSHLTLENIRATRLEIKNELLELEKNKSNMKDYIFKTKKKGIEILIKNSETKEKIWNEFYKAQDKIIRKTEANEENLNDFFIILDLNAKIYKDTAETAILRKEAKDVLENLNTIANIGDVMTGIENTWYEINDIIEKMGKGFENKK